MHTDSSFRLKAKNARYINMILFLVQQFMKFIATSSTVPTQQQQHAGTNNNGNNNCNNNKSSNTTALYSINEFLFSSQIDNLNLFKIEKYFQKSEIVKKVIGRGNEIEIGR